MKHPLFLCDLQEITDKQPLGLEKEGVSLVLVINGQNISVFEDRCPHQGTLLSEGWVEDGHLVCRTHQWRFDCGNGEKPKEPQVCLRSFPAEIREGKVWMEKEVLDQFKSRQQKQKKESSQQRIPDVLRAKDLPGPKGWPIFGNTFQINISLLHQKLEDWAREFGTFYRVKIGSRNMLVSTDPELNLEILKKRPQHFRRSSKMDGILQNIGIIGVFNAEGEQWRRQRQFVMEGLANKHLRSFFPSIVRVTERLLEKWQKAARDQEVLEIQKDLMLYTVDITTNLAFGYDMNTIEHQEDVIQNHMEKIFPTIQRRLFTPVPYWKFFKLPQDVQTEKATRAIRTEINRMIKESKKRIQEKPELQDAPSNFLEALLVAKDEDGSTFSENEIYSNVFVMLMAGEDTTANTIAWIMYYLSLYPKVMEKARLEVDKVLGDAALIKDFTLSRDLSYLDAIALETLRFKPVAPIITATATMDTNAKGVSIPQGTEIVILTRPPVLKDEHYAEADQFLPERWLDPNFRKQEKFSIPFGSGPRLCPGRSLALLEIKTAIAMLVKNFDVHLNGRKEDVQEFMAFTMMPKNLKISLKARTLVEEA